MQGRFVHVVAAAISRLLVNGGEAHRLWHKGDVHDFGFPSGDAGVLQDDTV